MGIEMTKKYYRKNAVQYSQDTINLDMSEIYSQFCQYLKLGDRILDAGSGSVRDPHVHYDGKKIIFSRRKSGSLYYHLYEILYIR